MYQTADIELVPGGSGVWEDVAIFNNNGTNECIEDRLTITLLNIQININLYTRDGKIVQF